MVIYNVHESLRPARCEGIGRAFTIELASARGQRAAGEVASATMLLGGAAGGFGER